MHKWKLMLFITLGFLLLIFALHFVCRASYLEHDPELPLLRAYRFPATGIGRFSYYFCYPLASLEMRLTHSRYVWLYEQTPPAQPEFVSGSVTRADGDKAWIEVDHEDVLPGTRFMVLRGDDYVGRVECLSSSGTTAQCRALRDFTEGREVRVGDSVSTRSF